MVLRFKIHYIDGGRRRRPKIEYTGKMLNFFKNNKTITKKDLRNKMSEIYGNFLIDEVDENGNTLLHLAVEYKRDTDIFDLFFDEYSAKIIRNINGETPLYLAVKNKINKDIIKYLIDKYEVIVEEFNTYEDKKKIAEKYGVKKDDLEQIISKKPNRFKKGAPIEEVKENKVKVKVIDIPDKSGKTPLVLALEQNNTEIVKLLISKGASTKDLSEDNKKLVAATQ